MTHLETKLSRQLLLTGFLLIAFFLRIYNLHQVPNGLFIDEAIRGYDAYSISQTGRDTFGEYLPLFPRGFDDYTPALFTYISVPFVFFLNLSSFSSRLPSVWIGLISVALSYQLIRHSFGNTAGIISLGLLAISPWHILLSRLGTEWILLGLGPILTITLLYRGLNSPHWLIIAGAIGGIMLYGYAPIKAFLPLLILIFIIFHWRHLARHKKIVLITIIIFAIFSYPIYRFSFTPKGLIRMQEVAYFSWLPFNKAIFLLITKYITHFDPLWLFMTDAEQPHVFIQRLKHVGLLYWFEFPLILIGIYLLLKSGRKEYYFWLAWLLLSPLSSSLHIDGPKPALWLTALPVPQLLASLGTIYLVRRANRINPTVGFMTIGILGMIMMGSVGRLVNDLFYEFPNYATQDIYWGYGYPQAIADLTSFGPAFDSTNVHINTTGNIAVSSIYLAYYTRFPPQQRQQQLTSHGKDGWQQLGQINIREITTIVDQPGCHLILTSSDKQFSLPTPNIPIKKYALPNGQPSPLFMLLATTSAHTTLQPMQAIFGQQIGLTSFGITTTPMDSHVTMEPGQAICVVLNWQSTGGLSNDYTAFVHLIGPTNPTSNSPLWAQHDSVPRGGTRPTSSWQQGELISDMHILFIPPDAPSETYTLQAGLYDSTNQQRLFVQQDNDNGEQTDAVALLKISVTREE